MAGIIGRVTKFEIENLETAKVGFSTFDPGGGNLLRGRNFTSPGVDARPLPGDYTLAVSTQETGIFDSLGYLDPNSSQKSQNGEFRAYSRDADKVEKAELWIKADGTIVLRSGQTVVEINDQRVSVENGVGSLSLESGGSVLINGVEIDSAGNIFAPGTVSGKTVEAETSLTVATKEVNLHSHAGVSPGSSVTSPF